MKKEAIIFLICILLMQFVIADTTFFEGDLGYTEDFLIVPSVSTETPTTVSGGGGGGSIGIVAEVIILENNLDIKICEICFESIKNQVKEKRTIEYTENELHALTLDINTQLNSGLSKSYISSFITNFEDQCEMSLPLSIAFAGGRFRDLITPLMSFMLVIIIIFLVIIILITKRAKEIKEGEK